MDPVSKLSIWYGKAARPLPWRKNHDPYRIWLSEIMLQQTQVITVIPYFERFLKKFPTLEALARAKDEEVLALWSGLGYYSRARNLLKGARTIIDDFGGNFPKDRKTILTVSGVGPYTAGAILSIAFDLPEPLVDGNVERVFARYFGIREPLTSVKNFLWSKAEEWVRESRSPRVLNQAMMELGATVCTKANPSCEQCPIQFGCVAFKKNLQAELPLKKDKPSVERLFWIGLVMESKGKYFLRKNGPGEWWQDLWDFPRLEFADAKKMKRAADSLEATPLQATRHTVTHHRIHLHPYRLKKRIATLPKEGKWFSESELADLPLSSLTRKVFDLCIAQGK